MVFFLCTFFSTNVTDVTPFKTANMKLVDITALKEIRYRLCAKQTYKFVVDSTVMYWILILQVVFERDVEGSVSPKHVKRTLFGSMNPYPQKKILTFNKHQNDFSFHVGYAELDHLSDLEIK